MNGIGIQLDGDTDFLEVPSDTSIELTINNPLLGDVSVLSPGSYSLPFTVPAGKASPNNAGKLKHPDVMENNEAYQLQKASLHINGLKYKKGTLKSASMGDQVDANFLFGLSQIDQRLKTARLRDIMNEQVVIDNSNVYKKIYFKKTTSGDWTVTINGKDYTAADASSIVSAINTESSSAADQGSFVPFAVLESSAASPGGMAAPYVIINAARVHYLGGGSYSHLDSTDPLVELNIRVESAEAANYKFESFDMTAYFGVFETFLANYISGAFPTNKYRFPVMFNASLYSSDGNVTKTSEIINAVNASGLVINDWHLLKNHNSIQPILLLKYVLDKIANTFSFQWEGDAYSDPELANFIIDNSRTLDVPMDYIGDAKFVFWQRSFNLNELVPDLSVVDFLKAYASRYNLGIYPSDITGKVQLKWREKIALSIEYDDITEFCSPIKNREDERVAGFNLVCEKDASDLFSQSESLAVGVAETPVNILCGRLWQMLFSNDGLSLGPRVSRKNNDSGFKLRLFHFKGMVNNGTYSYQAADIHGPTYQESLGDFILSPGLYTTFFKFWLLFEKNRRKITLDVKWPLRLLLRFDFEKKLRFDRMNYLLSSMKLKITNRGLQSVEADLITMKN